MTGPMSFISAQFVVFVFCALLVFYLVPKKWQWCVLLVASYYFYLCTGLRNLYFILTTTISTYLFARLIAKETDKQKDYLKQHKESLTKEEKKSYKAAVKKKQRWLLLACLLLNFGILFFLKYANFSISYINLFRLHFFHNTNFVGFLDLFLPLGISFYTFQSMGYLIDIYYAKYDAEKNPFRFALYVSFFPQIIQGPISRFGALAPELYKETAFDFYRIKSGFYRIMWGLFKKLVIADRLALYVTTAMDFRTDYKGVYLFLAVFFYSMQIYGDFSGGIDIAIGVSELFGIRMAENFERPFFSKNIAEYWRRWHITLGTWFKDYIFYPLSISKRVMNFGKWVRTHGSEALGKRIPIYLPMIIVWATTGMWHGSDNRYVVWGLLNCLLIILGTELEPVSQKLIEKLHIDEKGLPLKVFRIVKTFWLMAFLRIFDISANTGAAIETMKYMFQEIPTFRFQTIFENLNLPLEEFVVACIAIGILFCVSMLQRTGSLRERIFALPTALQWVVLGTLVGVVVIFGAYGRGFDAQQFIYLQF